MAVWFKGIHVGPWDITLMLAVALMALLLAYLYQPRWKALILSLPIPFSISVMALGRPVDATNILGIIALLIFTHGVRVLHCEWRVPIFPSIILSVAAFCGVSVSLARVVPGSDAAFWGCWIGIMGLSALLLRLQPPRIEPGHREELPVWIKFPLILCITAGLVIGKSYLKGFMSLFPMVGVFAAYEGRHALWTISRQISVLALIILPMQAVIRLTQGHLGLLPALACGWVLYLTLLIPTTVRMWRNEEARREEGLVTERVKT